MKYLTKLLLCAVVMAALVSCIESQPSSATFSQGVAFEMDEFTFSDHFKDSLMFLPQISFDPETGELNRRLLAARAFRKPRG